MVYDEIHKKWNEQKIGDIKDLSGKDGKIVQLDGRHPKQRDFNVSFG